MVMTPREQEDPSLDVKWRQFRCDQITEVANMIAEVVHSYGKTMAASPFPYSEDVLAHGTSGLGQMES